MTTPPPSPSSNTPPDPQKTDVDEARQRRRARALKKTPWWNRPWARQGGLVLLIVVGFGLLAQRGWDYLQWRDSQQWIATPGEVTRVARPRPSGQTKAPSGGFGAPRTAEAKWVTYIYQYEAQGQPYTSRKVSYAISGESVPLEWIPELPVKGPATVYVDPADPSRSVLRIGDTFQWWSLRLAIGLFMVVGGSVRLGYMRAGY